MGVVTTYALGSHEICRCVLQRGSTLELGELKEGSVRRSPQMAEGSPFELVSRTPVFTPRKRVFAIEPHPDGGPISADSFAKNQASVAGSGMARSFDR